MELTQIIESLIDERIQNALEGLPDRPSKKALNLKETAEYIGYSPAWVKANKDSLPERLSSCPIRYHIADLDEWLEGQRKHKLFEKKKVGKVTIRPVKKEKK